MRIYQQNKSVEETKKQYEEMLAAAKKVKANYEEVLQEVKAKSAEYKKAFQSLLKAIKKQHN